MISEKNNTSLIVAFQKSSKFRKWLLGRGSNNHPESIRFILKKISINNGIVK